MEADDRLVIPLGLRRSHKLRIYQRRKPNGDRVDPEYRDVLFDAAVRYDVLVSQRLRQRGQTVNGYRYRYQNAHAAEGDDYTIGSDAQRWNPAVW